MVLRAMALGVSTAMLAGCGAMRDAAPASTVDAAGEAVGVVRVDTPAAFSAAVKAARPGDTIVLANGEWADFDAVFEGAGRADAPIRLVAETPGKVILTGQSSLRLAGEYLIVSGLVFRDGYSPRNEVISFRRDGESLANNSQVTNTVIDGYSNPDRTQRDLWVGLYGRNNSFDHNHLAGKINAGPTLAVRLTSEASQQNRHQITNNYFGPRPVFGSNGGETLRIGTSQYSLTQSLTLVENNFFDRCSGEVEIISNKSGGNVFRGNTFYASQGTLTLRHGNDALIENNLFDGAGAPYTGGVRVINAHQTIRNNYFKDLTGNRFAGALVVMNGVPNSPINRYHQVDGAVIEQNTFDNVAAIELGEGSDAERTARPVNSTFSNNVVVGSEERNPFNLYDDMSGIDFGGNTSVASPPTAIAAGIAVAPVSAREPRSGLLEPLGAAGARGAFGVSREATGVSWYAKPSEQSPFVGGREIRLEPGVDVLSEALSEAEPGDRYVLAPGRYVESRVVEISAPVTIQSSAPDEALIVFDRPRLFVLAGQGGLVLDGVEVSGELAPDGSGNAMVATSGGGNHVLELRNVSVRDFDVNRGFSVVSAGKGSFFDRIDVEGSSFTDVTGAVFKLDEETDDYGIYNAEYVNIVDSRFQNIGGPVVSIYRGGADESTFGPHVDVSGSTFDAVGGGREPLLALHGVQNGSFTSNRVSNAQPIQLTLTTGLPVFEASENTYDAGSADALLNVTDLRNRK